MGVAVSMAEALAAAVSMAGVSMAEGSTEETSAVALSMVAGFAVAVLVGATGMVAGTITDSLMMSSSAASAFRGGGAGAIRTDITVPAIIRTITIGTAGTVTKATRLWIPLWQPIRAFPEFAKAMTSPATAL